MIDSSWDEAIKNYQIPQTAEQARKQLWMGFVFVEGDKTGRNDNEKYVKSQIKDQLGHYFKQDDIHYKTADVRYCYTSQKKPVLDFSNGKDYIRELIENIK